METNLFESKRRAFTLVELLVVIVILSILAAIIVPAVFKVLSIAQKNAIQREMTGFVQQFSFFEAAYGSYPPSDPTQAAEYVQLISDHIDDAEAATEVVAFDSSSKALMFWLAGISADPDHPITGVGTRNYNYDFREKQLGPDSTYKPANESITQPYVYNRINERRIEITHAGLDDMPGTDDDLKISN